MKNKIFTFMIFSILSMVAVLGVVSATMTLYPNSYSASIQQGDSGSFTFKIYNDDSSANNYTLVNFTSIVSNLVASGKTMSSSAVSVGAMPSLVGSEENSSVILVSINVPASQAIGVYTGNITINAKENETGSSAESKVITLSINVLEADEPIACAYGNAHNNLRVKKIEFTNNGFSENVFGEDDEWFPIDEIQVEITIENKGDEKIEDIGLEWGLYDPSSGEWVIELDDEDEFDLKSDKSEVTTLTFTLEDVDMDLEDLSDGTHKFYVRATGYDNEYSEDICVLDSEEVSVIIESDFVVLDKITFSENALCDSEVVVSAKVWNIGDDDQEDVYVNIYNKELKIDQDIEIGDVDAFSSENLDAVIVIPASATTKTYNFIFSVYDDGEDIYENEYDNQESVFTIPVKVTCGGQGDSSNGEIPKVVVSASIKSGGNAGENLVVESTVTNLEAKSVSYEVSAESYSDWASSATVDKPVFTLPAGESKTILVTFTVNDDAQGEQTFDLEIVSGERLIASQPVSVEIEKSGFSYSNFWKANYLWIIALINIILIIAIIVIIVKIMSK